MPGGSTRMPAGLDAPVLEQLPAQCLAGREGHVEQAVVAEGSCTARQVRAHAQQSRPLAEEPKQGAGAHGEAADVRVVPTVADDRHRLVLLHQRRHLVQAGQVDGVAKADLIESPTAHREAETAKAHRG